jgi:hypothetical protein
MTWFQDLTPYSYLPLQLPALNVGWLELGMPFPTGTPEPAFVERLRLLTLRALSHSTRGTHSCDFCPPVTAEDLKRADGWETYPSGNGEIRALASDGTRFAAPMLISHYVESHGYAPPRPFVDAIMRCASLTWEAARDAGLCLSCGTPLERDEFSETYPSHRFGAPRCRGCGAWFYWR